MPFCQGIIFFGVNYCTPVPGFESIVLSRASAIANVANLQPVFVTCSQLADKSGAVLGEQVLNFILSKVKWVPFFPSDTDGGKRNKIEISMVKGRVSTAFKVQCAYLIVRLRQPQLFCAPLAWLIPNAFRHLQLAHAGFLGGG